MPCIPTESYACISTPWPLGNVYTAKSCRGTEEFPTGTCQLREKTLTESIDPQGLLGAAVGLTIQHRKIVCPEIRKRKVRAHTGLPMMIMMMMMVNLRKTCNFD
jgi:hypothetical protein